MTDLDAIRAAHAGDHPHGLDVYDDDRPCEVAIVLAALDKHIAVSEAIDTITELSSAAAIEREARLRNIALETLNSSRTRRGHKDCRENDCTLTALRAALATTPEGE